MMNYRFEISLDLKNLIVVNDVVYAGVVVNVSQLLLLMMMMTMKMMLDLLNQLYLNLVWVLVEQKMENLYYLNAYSCLFDCLTSYLCRQMMPLCCVYYVVQIKNHYLPHTMLLYYMHCHHIKSYSIENPLAIFG